MRALTPIRRGFSIIETLIVSFIIAVILSLLMPGVLAARSSAHRTQCLNNLRQVNLALANYEASMGFYPIGVSNPTGPIRSVPEGFHHSWVISLLPYMEQSMIAQMIDPDASIYDVMNQTMPRTTIRTLLCPDDPITGPFSSYAGCHHDVEAPVDVLQNGMFYLNSRTRRDDMVDGAATTILVGEKRIEGPALGDLGWPSGTRSTLRNTGTVINGTVAPNPDPSLTVGGFSSLHIGGGANFAFGDGSVRWLSQTIDPRIYRALGNRADGEVLDNSF